LHSGQRVSFMLNPPWDWTDEKTEFGYLKVVVGVSGRKQHLERTHTARRLEERKKLLVGCFWSQVEDGRSVRVVLTPAAKREQELAEPYSTRLY
jgi:peptidyl-tRNA hydrolase